MSEIVKSEYNALGEDNNYKTHYFKTSADQVVGLGRMKNTKYQVGDVVYSDNNMQVALKCTTVGITSNTELDISSNNAGDTVTDGGVVWEVIARSNVLDEVDVLPIANGGTGGSSFIKSASINGQDITLNMSDGTTKTLTTQDTTGIVAYNLGTASSYVKFSNGLIIQWGVSAIPNGSYYIDVALPISYPNNIYSVFITDEVWNTESFGDSRFAIVRYSGNTGTGSNAHNFRVACRESSIGAFNWFAIGY